MVIEIKKDQKIQSKQLFKVIVDGETIYSNMEYEEVIAITIGDLDKEGQIKVGDEVEFMQMNCKGVVLQIANNSHAYIIMTNSFDSLLRAKRNEIMKTGRHFDEIDHLVDCLREDI